MTDEFWPQTLAHNLAIGAGLCQAFADGASCCDCTLGIGEDRSSLAFWCMTFDDGNVWYPGCGWSM